ncbi:LuxR C-terminal-related transcriptional regulator [Streptomyces roseicoloratus]|uniref:LuxR C-terminal-related transcriptional regulator n=1 Tax=Streptomyces roseicoloratus TaxID=2508722 RepID=A0ABY9S1S3_9ACTN|nr:LuxR C-terminal-related transcriptional regulator [Streptomyces roseicoloratus]WMX47399.1 LuxR C-terminal-related transcriptional regulator [Streptomyces roseicoloratus]
MRLCEDRCPAESPDLCREALEVYRTAVASGELKDPPPPCPTALELLRPHPEDPGRLVPVPPDVAEHHLVQPLEQELQAGRSRLLSVRQVLAGVESVYREESRRAPSPLQLLRGNDVIHKKLRQLNAECRHELQAIQPGGPRSAPALAEALQQLPGVIARGVRHRTLYQHTVRGHRPMIEFMTAIQKAGGQFRTTDLLADRVILYDRSVALIPDHRYSRPDHALLIEHPAVAAYLAGVFDLIWDAAEPVEPFETPASTPPLLADEKQLSVLRLMVQGHTDASIAARLGMSARTVSAHVNRASTTWGSRSRAHLAYLLAENDALRTPPES